MEVSGVECGNSVKNLTLQLMANHGGESCEKRYSCENDACYTKTTTKPGSGMFKVYFD